MATRRGRRYGRGCGQAPTVMVCRGGKQGGGGCGHVKEDVIVLDSERLSRSWAKEDDGVHDGRNGWHGGAVSVRLMQVSNLLGGIRLQLICGMGRWFRRIEAWISVSRHAGCAHLPPRDSTITAFAGGFSLRLLGNYTDTGR